MAGMLRYSVQFEDRHGVWIHWRAFDSESAAIRECELIAARHLNSRVKDVLDWSGPAVAYREAHKETKP
jgi:hypothetical protein